MFRNYDVRDVVVQVLAALLIALALYLAMAQWDTPAEASQAPQWRRVDVIVQCWNADGSERWSDNVQAARWGHDGVLYVRFGPRHNTYPAELEIAPGNSCTVSRSYFQ